MGKNRIKSIVFLSFIAAIAAFVFLLNSAVFAEEEGPYCKDQDGYYEADKSKGCDEGDSEGLPSGVFISDPDNICCKKSSSNNGNNSSSGSSEKIKNLEKIPGQEQTDDLVTYLNQIYAFGIAVAAILAVFMVSLGAFIYIVSSAGNAGKKADAKEMITNAIYGMILAFVAWLLIYIINPDLISGTIRGTTGTDDIVKESGIQSSGGKGSGKCEPVGAGPCSEDSLADTCFSQFEAENPDIYYQASSICNAESGGNEKAASGSDKCKSSYVYSDGDSFSWGLFQINLTCEYRDSSASSLCDNAFTPQNSSGCINYDCNVTASTVSQYKECVDYYQDVENNIERACEYYRMGGWNKWGANSICGF